MLGCCVARVYIQELGGYVLATADCRAEGYEQKASAMNETLQVPSCAVRIEYVWLS